MNHFITSIECAGKNCKKEGINILKISFVNRRGIFCRSCTEDLLRHGLATIEIEDRDLGSVEALGSVGTLASNAKTSHRIGNPNDGQQ